MSASIKLLGVDEFKNSMSVKLKSMISLSEKQIVSLATGIHSEIIKNISKHGSGIIYKRAKGGNLRTHQASSANNPPATDTGNLKRNIKISFRRVNKNLTGIIKSSAPYSAALEFGTRKMAKRPFMGPAVDKNKKKIISKMSKAIKNGLEK